MRTWQSWSNASDCKSEENILRACSSQAVRSKLEILMNKKTVRYSDVEPGIKIQVGQRYQLYPIDHTSPFVSNSRWCSTSPVVSFNRKTGEIETCYSIYMPNDADALKSFRKNNPK